MLRDFLRVCSLVLFLLRLFDFIWVAMLSTSIWLFNVALVVEISTLSVSMAIGLFGLAMVVDISVFLVDRKSRPLESCML